MAARTLRLPLRIREDIERRALASLPRECCGVLLGSRDGDATVVAETRRADNVHPGDRERRYSVAPEILLEALQTSRRGGLEVVGYYHSHPSGDARPSESDRETAWPGVSYLIIAAREAGAGEIRSWRLSDGGAGFGEEKIRYAGRSPDPTRTSDP